MKKILVVDDEENIRILYRDEFTDLGYQVLLASSGDEALEIIKNDRPDLVTLDIKMEGLDGIETLRRIKELDKSLPVVLCTAYNVFKRDFGTWASDAYVVKSSSMEELKNAVGELLS